MSNECTQDHACMQCRISYMASGKYCALFRSCGFGKSQKILHQSKGRQSCDTVDQKNPFSIDGWPACETQKAATQRMLKKSHAHEWGGKALARAPSCKLARKNRMAAFRQLQAAPHYRNRT